MKTPRIEPDWVSRSSPRNTVARGQVLLVTLCLCALPALGFHWDSDAGPHQLGHPSTSLLSYRIVDEDLTGDALAVYWKDDELN